MADFFKVSTDLLLGRNTENTISVAELTDEQVSHIRLLIKDFSELNQK